MVLRGLSVTALFSGILVYTAIFVMVRQGIALEGSAVTEMRLGLLLFTLPGVLSALMSREKPLTLALLASLVATPLCLSITSMQFLHGQSIWQETAWLSSAVFWCVMGALTTMLWRELWRIYRQG
ncbi:hypothetical protein CIG19_07750 [Enterobacterales bacterium CwR94]|nr:hypothetical protein CIG19_07750 [Enterobacterales bacterium CwR94]